MDRDELTPIAAPADIEELETESDPEDEDEILGLEDILDDGAIPDDDAPQVPARSTGVDPSARRAQNRRSTPREYTPRRATLSGDPYPCRRLEDGRFEVSGIPGRRGPVIYRTVDLDAESESSPSYRPGRMKHDARPPQKPSGAIRDGIVHVRTRDRRAEANELADRVFGNPDFPARTTSVIRLPDDGGVRHE